MKSKFILFYILLIYQFAVGQVDKNGQPIQFSKQIDSSKHDNFTLKVNYISIKENLDNKKSALHIWDNPTNKNYLNWAKGITSYVFKAYINGEFYLEIDLNQKSIGNEEKYVYSLIKPGLGLYDTTLCTIRGEITEHRANELIENNYDKTAFIQNKENFEFLTFDGEELLILSYPEIKKEVLNLINSDISDKTFKENRIKSNPIEYIKKESIDGELDFSKMLIGYGENNSDEKIYLYSIAIWSRAVKELGITDVNKIISIWEDIHKKKARKKIKNAIIYGYQTE